VKGFFVTGTDTDVGKTWFSGALLHRLNQAGLETVAMKPVSAGCKWQDGQWQNDDALLLMREMSSEADYQDVNPYAFEPAMAPHLAAEQAGVEITFATIEEKLKLLTANDQTVVIEGAGGWLVPLNKTQSVADLAQSIGLPIIMVVSIRLGCLNHALLTAESIQGSGLPLAGWVANIGEREYELANENIASLQKRLKSPLIGRLPFTEKYMPQVLAKSLDYELLLENIDLDQ